ncbi:hypothetical protein [Telluribacter sp.]|jgi:hypothetical protein|uniref:hypothetical protein n=1 Tax=Telluribacter sp. TaxID=1978767 RepID=UPI002E0D983D|nr:hypothetical protein [Telluribacter sp.]
MKKLAVYTTLFTFYYLLIEVGLRLFYFGFATCIFNPYHSFIKKHYSELAPIFAQNTREEKDVKNILILGGSVVSTNWSHLETRLEKLLQPHLSKGSAIRVYNAAAPANTSLDNLIKYKLVANQHFDLVIYYEAINENRFNNVPSELFREDYSHVVWYRDVHLIVQHTELKYTVIPYTLHFIYKKLKHLYTKPASLDMNSVPFDYVTHGSEIKTSVSYRKNIQELINIAKSRQEPLLLMSYASFFPEGVHLTGTETDKSYFGKCKYQSSISIWGTPENVQKGIKVHNDQLRELVALNKISFLDMDVALPRNKENFCDICHLREETGVQQFANILKDHIFSEHLLGL